MIDSECIHIHLLSHKDIEALGTVDVPWSIQEEMLALKQLATEKEGG